MAKKKAVRKDLKLNPSNIKILEDGSLRIDSPEVANLFKEERIDEMTEGIQGEQISVGIVISPSI